MCQLSYGMSVAMLCYVPLSVCPQQTNKSGTLPSTTSISSAAACTSTKCASLCHVTDSSKTATITVTSTPPPSGVTVAVP
jgi:hypothetical protein